MRFQKYILCAVVALTTFGVAVGLLDIAGFFTNLFRTKEPEARSVQPVEKKTANLYDILPPEVTVFQPQVVPSPFTMPVTEVKTEEKTEIENDSEFSPDGDFYFLENTRKAFKDLDSLSIETKDYEKASEENDYEGVPIPPKGYILTKGKKFNFTRISVSPKQLSFETETIKGVSYKFTGKYVDEEVKIKATDGEEYDVYINIKGTLTKMRDGKKIAQFEAKFVTLDC